MEKLNNKIENILAQYNYTLKNFNIIGKEYNNTIVEVNCERKNFIIKLFSNENIDNLPTIGDPKDKFVGGWYVQSRVSNNLEDTVPDVIGSGFSESLNYYIMDKVQYKYDHNWSNNMYLMQLCQDLGSQLSDIHQISNNLIGGIPGKNSDPMINMRRYIKKVETNIRETKYKKYQDELNELSTEYEKLYEPTNKWLVHAELEPTNILTDDSGLIRSIVDWDNSMYGDPLLDIAMCEANICEIYKNKSPWDSETIRDALIESYQHAVNPKRLKILRSIVCLNTAAKLNHPHRKVNYTIDNKDIESLHIKLFNDTIDTIE